MKIALDLGGTNIRIGLVDNSGQCTGHHSVPCRATETEDVVVSQICELIADLLEGDGRQADGIGIGVPSVVDSDRGIVYTACNIPSCRDVHLKEIIEDRFRIETRVANDCNCFALGEHRYGAGRGAADMVGITLGTGVGSGLILGGHLYVGVLSGAGEIGSLPYLDSDYEHYCSSLWLRDKCHTTGADLAARAVAGDAEALATWHLFGRHLGELTKAILFAYAPERIVVGGGIAASMPLFRAGWAEAVSTFPYPAIAQRCTMERAVLPDANLIGAALLFHDI
ncbi:MAG: ROK family protein [Candidatus Amulumruptor sp.]|nr:ROK family protein [Candidatus Amulumruptor sp.]